MYREVNSVEFLISLHTDKRLLEWLLTPKVVIKEYGYSIKIENLCCDHCETQLPITKPGGYALFDIEGTLWELMCEQCRQRFHSGAPVYETIQQAIAPKARWLR